MMMNEQERMLTFWRWTSRATAVLLMVAGGVLAATLDVHKVAGEVWVMVAVALLVALVDGNAAGRYSEAKRQEKARRL